MIPLKSHPKWEALVKGDIKTNFKVFSGNMMLNQLSRSMKRDNSNNNLQDCIDQAYNYFVKFENLFHDELNSLFR